MKAICVMKGDVSGKIVFSQNSSEDVLHISGEIIGLERGNHGFHVHEFGDVSNGCVSAGEHFNPFHKNHGGLNDINKHLGDLGNVLSKGERVTKVNIMDKEMSLYGMYSVLGRSLVVHTMEDDCGKENNAESKKTGNSGGRLACGVIGVMSSNSIKTVSF